MPYQHLKPQRDLDHEPTPVKVGGNIKKPERCADCGEPVKQVDASEGPESLKALFPLR